MVQDLTVSESLIWKSSPASDIDVFAEEEQELEAVVESLDKTCTLYKIGEMCWKDKTMTNSTNGIQREGRSLEQWQALSTWEQYFRWRLKTGGSLKNCTNHCNSDKAEANMDR